jgi:hypothetical protein
MKCPGAKTCGCTWCCHYKKHKYVEGCSNGCFGNTGCVKEKNGESLRNVRSEVQTKS